MLTHLKGLKSAPQYPIAVDVACWQGEAVCAVVARTRAEAEDACELVGVSYQELPAVVDPETALDAKTPVIHASLGDNLCFERKLEAGAVDKAFAESDAVVETTFMFGRHTGVTIEPRAVLADWNPASSGDRLSRHAGAAHDAERVRQASRPGRASSARAAPRTSAAPSASRCTFTPTRWRPWRCRKLLKRPVKFVADRIESFVTDIHARDHRIKARIGVKNDGTITAFEIDDLTGIGPYSVYPRTSGIEGQPGGQPRRRPLHLPELPRAGARGVPE